VPKRDFFQSLFLDDSIKMTFQALHRMFTTEYNNVNIRQGRKKCFESIFDWVFERASFYQRHSPGWSDDESVKLPLAQRLWLDSHHFENRKNHPDWQDDIIKSFATWTTVTYRRLRKRTGDAVTLGATEETAFMDELRDYSRRVGEDLV
jgi:CRISPR-associated protein Csy1